MTKRKHMIEIVGCKSGLTRNVAGRALRRAMLVCAASVLAALAGCQSTGSSRSNQSDHASQSANGNVQAGMPASFAFSIAIPEGVAKAGEPLEPAWYFLDANGTLRATFGKGAAAMSGDVKPPRIMRNISREDRERLYAVLRDADVFAVPRVGQSVGDAQETLAQQAEIGSQLQGAAMVGVWWTAGERRRSFVMVPVQKSASQSEAAGVWSGLEQAVGLMREWMWKSDANAAVVAR
ncbi:MAG: hypothetical protein U0640_00565 [Phycisphaerales bacterium]